ncbi:nose resistant to fluoxetine protein 6 [Caerostris darwini]|uniref:Nose resistant to fluoxetine protein 6 n=1 Tax=Caerostris darwini TaxID=1538125 RepID=A0AAV4QUS3_9ARAC|nr:nose resistant to fluoxetine protein 6 [Caerostris darwini]
MIYTKFINGSIAVNFENGTEIENQLSNLMRAILKNILPSVVNIVDASSLSKDCVQSLSRYASDLIDVRAWAMKMFDSTSKLPSGILEGTLSELGSYDQCLNVEVPFNNGSIDLQGQYCGVEIDRILPKIPFNFYLGKTHKTDPLGSVGKLIEDVGSIFFYSKFRFGVCVPSKCTQQDMQRMALEVAKRIKMNVSMKQCYSKTPLVFEPIHIGVICAVSILLIVSIWGSCLEYKSMKVSITEKNESKLEKVLLCFSLISNYRHLISPSERSDKLKVIQGMKALTIAWVMFGHNYAWTNFPLARRPRVLTDAYHKLQFGLILNSCGLIAGYTVLQVLPALNGKMNFILYVLRRYFKVLILLLLVIGLAFFMPIASSGPFWYDVVDPELKNCRNNWWFSVLFISNWISMKDILKPTANNVNLKLKPTINNINLQMKPTINNVNLKLKPTTNNVNLKLKPTTNNVNFKLEPTSNNVNLKLKPTTNNVNFKLKPTSNNVNLKLKPTTNNVNLKLKPTSNNVNFKLEPTTNNVNLKLKPTTNNVNFKLEPTTNNVNLKLKPTTNNVNFKLKPTTNNVNLKLKPTSNNCISPVSWYISTDLQLHAISVIPLYVLYKSRKLGVIFVICIIIACSSAIAAATYLNDLLPFVQMNYGDKQKIQNTIDYVHLRPFTHAGPYYIGLLLGVIVLDFKDIRLSVAQNILGWTGSIMLALTALYGGHSWNTGHPESPEVTALFASVHRTTFALGVAWIVFVCITKNGGPVNSLLSSPMLAPAGKLTFIIFMVHSLIFWVRKASVRERMFVSHYNLMYGYIGNIVFTVMICIPCHLLLEAPVTKLDLLLFTAKKNEEENETKPIKNGSSPENIVIHSCPQNTLFSEDYRKNFPKEIHKAYINYPKNETVGNNCYKTVIQVKPKTSCKKQ